MGTRVFESLATVTFITLAATAPAAAMTFTYDASDLGGNDKVGSHKNILTTFNDTTDLFTWQTTFQANPGSGKLADGAWLVVSEGPLPRENVQEYTMFYLDGINNKVSMYSYNGLNNNSSWRDDDSVYLGEIALTVNNDIAGERTFSFSYDMTAINAHQDLGEDWKGTFFNDSIGIWLHGVHGLEAAYDTSDGSLSQFSYNSKGWYDVAYKDTEAIPTPGLTLGLGLVGWLAARRRKHIS